MFNPWFLLAFAVAFIGWSGGMVKIGYDLNEAKHASDAIKQLAREQEAAKEITEEREEQSKEINQTRRKIKDEAAKNSDAPASDRLRAIADGVRKQWDKDHK